jgi:hypothetical protein
MMIHSAEFISKFHVEPRYIRGSANVEDGKELELASIPIKLDGTYEFVDRFQRVNAVITWYTNRSEDSRGQAQDHVKSDG